MKFLDKIKDLFSDEEEVIETKEIEEEENKEHKLPTFMRNKIEEEEKREEKREEIVKDTPVERNSLDMISDREIVKTRSNSFSFPIEMDDTPPMVRRSNQNVLDKEKSISSLYNNKKEEVKPTRFRPTPVISPVYGILDKNYTKDEVKVQDENSYEIQRPSRKIDFETVRNKAFGSLTDDVRNNLCENCELYQEVKITKNAKDKKDDTNLLSDMTDKKEEDISLGDAEDNYFDFGVSYEPPKGDNSTVINIDEVEINNDIKIVNHNEEESTAEKIEVKEVEDKEEDKLLEDTKEFEKVTNEEDIDSILSEEDSVPLSEDNDIFNLIDSMYDEEEKK